MTASENLVAEPSAEAVIARIRAELCDPLIRKPVEAWGPVPKNGGDGFVKCWTDVISKDIGSSRHYITCEGSHNGSACTGRWSRRARQQLQPGLYCIFGSRIDYDGTVIRECETGPKEKRTLARLRGLWAEHWLQPDTSERGNEELSTRPLVDHDEIETIHSMLAKALAKNAAAKKLNGKEKALGNGEGGWEGVVQSGVVMKRDTGSSILGKHEDRCDLEPGGHFHVGDLEVWVTWHGWSGLAIRDGRFRPGYHLELLLCLMTTVVDYGANRQLWRARESPWAVGADWVWEHTPCDISIRFADGIKMDLKEILRREIERLSNTAPTEYQADEGRSREAQYPLLLDRVGEAVSRHLAGEPLTTARGYISAWILCVPNDIQDYERDVLGGETNNLCRSLTSEQQVVDGAYAVLLIIERAIEHEDFDISDSILGTLTYGLQCWRYNTGKQFAHYGPQSVRDQGFTRPPEVSDLLSLVKKHYPSDQSWDDSYGSLYDRLDARIKALYWGCTCDKEPHGHDNWKLLARSLDGEPNDGIEERVSLTLSALCIGASHGDFRCECAMDLSLYIGFTRFFQPDTGLVARMHYRVCTGAGNSLTE